MNLPHKQRGQAFETLRLIQGGTGHRPVTAGDPPAARAPRATVLVRDPVVPNCGRKLPPQTGRWHVPPGRGAEPFRLGKLQGLWLLLVAVWWVMGAPAFAQESNSAAPKRLVLKPSAIWQINLPDRSRYDTSALMLRPDGELWTMADNHTHLYRIDFLKGTNAASLTLLPQFLKSSHLAPFAREKIDRYDTEGLARDDLGRIYVSEEANRWILRMAPDGSSLERLAIDWSPVAKHFDRTEGNSSFEGVAVISNRLYVANERNMPRIIVVDLETLKVIDDFCPTYNVPLVNEAHFSDLAAYNGRLFILVRSRALILEVDPATKRVVAEYDWSACERDPDSAYQARFNTGNMEGLAIDAGGFWMVTDNNGLGRTAHPNDTRPTLFRCPWPQ